MNIIGNYILIYGKLGMPEMGLLGAGISTLASRIMMVVVFLSLIHIYAVGHKRIGDIQRKMFECYIRAQASRSFLRGQIDTSQMSYLLTIMAYIGTVSYTHLRLLYPLRYPLACL